MAREREREMEREWESEGNREREREQERERERERDGARNSVLSTRLDDDDDDLMFCSIVPFICLNLSSFFLFNYFHRRDIERRQKQHSPVLLIRLLLMCRVACSILPWLDVQLFSLLRPLRKQYCIVWDEPPQALASMSMHTKQYMCYNQTGDISTLDWTFLKLVDKFTFLGSRISSTEKDIDTRLTKAWAANDRL